MRFFLWELALVGFHSLSSYFPHEFIMRNFMRISRTGLQHSQVHCEGRPKKNSTWGNNDEVGRWADMGVTTGTILTRVSGMSVTLTRMMGAGLPQTRVMLGLVLCPGVELPQSRSFLLGPHAVKTRLLQMLVQLGPVHPGAGLPQTRLTVLMVLLPHRRKSLRAWCLVLLGLFLTGFMLQRTTFWVLGPLRTRLKMIGLSAQMGPLPCGQGLLRDTSPVLLGHLLWESRLLWTNCGVPGCLRTGFSQLHLSACWWGWIGQVPSVGPALDSYQASQGLDTVSAVSSETDLLSYGWQH